MGLSILLTGASSFSGSWFARTLAARGHRVVAPLARSRDDYTGERSRRVADVSDVADVIFEAPCGSVRFLDVVRAQPALDVVSVHHAVVGDYKSAEFNVAEAVASSTAGAAEILDLAASRGARSVVLTRSVFEAGQGLTDDPRPIGLYAVAKTATVQSWAEHSRTAGLPFAQFTITNPFGPAEEPRFVAYLARTWRAGVTPMLKAPDWVRDNVPVPLLATAYAETVEESAVGRLRDIAPSHLVATNLDYAQRVGVELGSRWGLNCSVGVAGTPDTGEPRIRIGTDHVPWPSGVDETAFWDQYANYYAARLDG